MLKSYLIAVVGIGGLMTGWAFVQRMWGRFFMPGAPEADALEHRISCGNCGCSVPCENSAASREEEGRVSFASKSTH